MDIRTSDEDVYSTEYNQLHELYRADRFRDAWNQGCLWFGEKWPTPRLELLAARILGQLGNLRKADASILWLWRRCPQLSGLSHYTVSLITRRRGPLVALRMLSGVERRANPDAKDKAHLQGEKAEILARFRDFSAAEACLECADSQEDLWLSLTQAELKYAQDDYAEATVITNQVLDRDHQYRPALQFKANLLQLQNDLAGAIDLLANFWETSQSFWVGKQLCNLYIEDKQYTQAHHCIERLEKLPAFTCKEVQQSLRAMRADVLCAEQRYEEALQYLEQKNFYGKSVVESIKRASDTSTRKVLNVPFVRQHHMTCAPASLTAISMYWGVPVTHDQVVEEICYGGTQSVDERKWAHNNNWFVREFELSFPALKQLIDNEIPVLLATVEPGSAHLQIIVGYDEAMGTYLLRDPYYRRLQEMLIDGCHKHYASTGPRCMVIAPMADAEKIDAMHLPCYALYDQLYQLCLALDNNQREVALVALAQARALDKDHRITQNCERNLAYYDSDEPRILEATEKLLQQFPKDINFQLSKVHSLSSFGSTKQTREYLEHISSEENTHFLVKSRLADNLRWDHREQPRVEKLFKELLNYNPLHSESLYAYAGVLWDKGNFTDSYQLYRFATCLDDKNERYAESFFKAARYHKQTELGLTFLRDRFARFGKKSCGPAISFYNALDGLDRAHEGLIMLDEAMSLRPNDGWLMLFAARKFLYLQQAAKAITLLEAARPLINPIRYHELAAEIYEYNLDTKCAIGSYEQVLQLEPLNYNANHAMMRLYIEAGQRAKADEFIAQQLATFPDNAMLLRLHINWLDDAEHQDIVNAFQRFIRYHPADAWGYRGLSNALLKLERSDEALTAAKEAVAIENNSSANHAQLGDIYLAMHQRSPARASFRRALEIGCDYTYAYERLMQCGLSHEAQQQDLQFIYEQLMAQVSYGDGILEYQKIAWQLLSAAEITRFLRHAVDARPDLWQSWIALALAYRSQGENELALDLLKTAAQRFPLLPRTFMEIAETQRLLSKLNEAEASYKQVLELSPGWTVAANSLCELLERQHRIDEAIDLQNNMIARNPLAPSPYGFLADLLRRSGRKQEAVDALEKALARDPHYHWAWTTLNELLSELGRQEELLKKIHKVRKQFPDAAALALVHAEILKDDASAIDVLANFLLRQPHNVDVCVAYIHRQTDQHHFDHALQYTSETYWNGHRPNAILGAEAWVFSQQGNLAEAIKRMEQLTAINENYYDAWRLLARWYVEIKDKVNALRAINQCHRLYPNDASVLCYVAEKLQAIDGDKQRIGDLLRRAFELNPLNQYNGLTFIDYAITQGDYEQAEQALALLHKHNQDIYTRYREFQIAVAAKRLDDSLRIYQTILQDNDATEWFVLNGWQLLADAQYAEKTAELIHQLRESGTSIASEAGRCLGLYEFEQKKPGIFEQQLLAREVNDKFDHRYLEGYLRGLIKTKRELPWKINEQFSASFTADVENWGLIGYLNVILGRWNEAVHWLGRSYPRADAQGWMLYFYALALRETGRWDDSVRIIADAFHKAPDHYREDIVIWYSLDQLLANKPAPLAELHYVDSNDLAGMSCYPLAVVKTLAALNNRSFVDACTDIAPQLRECQTQWQELSYSTACRHTKKRARKFIANTIQQKPLLKLLWLWKLANQF
ncbi:MAG: C39 family peptidase [Cellvibrio sp.]|uniref:tetratricopeptide repeat protein n=1 Tax=Cellvibrio sp. TaxID=1965322 RepID=UPI00271E4410|nr:C39 family peptidase [Cellvibrio sp.]